jgi:hypothetical protein
LKNKYFFTSLLFQSLHYQTEILTLLLFDRYLVLILSRHVLSYKNHKHLNQNENSNEQHEKKTERERQREKTIHFIVNILFSLNLVL